MICGYGIHFTFPLAQKKSRPLDHRGDGLWRIGIGLKTDPEICAGDALSKKLAHLLQSADD
jgi:hypothetical protein